MTEQNTSSAGGMIAQNFAYINFTYKSFGERLVQEQGMGHRNNAQKDKVFLSTPRGTGSGGRDLPSITPRPLYPQDRTAVLFNMKLVGSQGRYWSFEEKYFLPCAGTLTTIRRLSISQTGRSTDYASPGVCHGIILNWTTTGFLCMLYV